MKQENTFQFSTISSPSGSFDFRGGNSSYSIRSVKIGKINGVQVSETEVGYGRANPDPSWISDTGASLLVDEYDDYTDQSRSAGIAWYQNESNKGLQINISQSARYSAKIKDDYFEGYNGSGNRYNYRVTVPKSGRSFSIPAIIITYEVTDKKDGSTKVVSGELISTTSGDSSWASCSPSGGSAQPNNTGLSRTTGWGFRYGLPGFSEPMEQTFYVLISQEG